MLPPIRCVTCSTFVGQTINLYAENVRSGMDKDDALDSAGITRLCCRTHVLSVPHIAFSVSVQPTGDRTVFDSRVNIRADLAVPRTISIA